MFQVQTSDPVNAGSYTIKVTGFLPNKQSAYVTFKFNILSIAGESITAKPIPDVTYKVRDTALTFTFDEFISSDSSLYILYFLQY